MMNCWGSTMAWLRTMRRRMGNWLIYRKVRSSLIFSTPYAMMKPAVSPLLVYQPLTITSSRILFLVYILVSIPTTKLESSTTLNAHGITSTAYGSILWTEKKKNQQSIIAMIVVGNLVLNLLWLCKHFACLLLGHKTSIHIFFKKQEVDHDK